MIASGMANIEHSAQQQITQIEANKQANLEKLNVKFSSADTAKSSFGFIGIICVSVLFGGFLLNDFLKLGYYLYQNYHRNLAKYQLENNIPISSTEKEKGTELIQQLDDIYSQQLEDRLERMHLRLLKAKHSANKQNSRHLDYITI